jgi:hypothetical protein
LVIGGALIGATVSAVAQYNNTGSVNWGEVGGAALAGAAVGLTVAVAAPMLVGMVGQGLMGAGMLAGGTSTLSTTLWSAGMATLGAANLLANAMVGVSSVSTNNNPLGDIEYTDKVLDQATWDDYHGFSEHVDAFGADGTVTEIAGGDGVTYTQIQIPGSMRNYNADGTWYDVDGTFDYIIAPDGMCNHRCFSPE